MRIVAIAIALSVSLAACSDSKDGPSGPPPAGCDQISLNGTCFEQAGLTAGDCAGTFLPEGCDRTAAWVGTCIDATATSHYYSPFRNAYDEHVACDEIGGMWIGTGAPTGSAWCEQLMLGYSFCVDVQGPEDEVQVVEWDLEMWGTCYASGACPTAGRIGTCSGVSGGVTMWIRIYDPATAEALTCNGTWTPG